MLWKLLKQHISVSQLLGFFLANLFGMIVVLLSIQFYRDIEPMFSSNESFIKKDFVVVSKKVSTLGSLVGNDGTFSPGEQEDVAEQPFVKQVGAFSPAQFKVSAALGLKGTRISSALFFESVPDAFVDINLEKWQYTPEVDEIPIVVPRNYLNLYNYGFAQSRNLPQLSEGMMGMISLDIYLSGNGNRQVMKGRIVGFSNRLNTILVPESFMKWANAKFGGKKVERPSRLIVEVTNPADEQLAAFFKDRGYETEDNKLDAGKTSWFLKVVIGLVLGVGLLISILSFYILMLSIYILLQKNAVKMQNLLLLGYTPAQVAMPYQMLTLFLNASVFLLSVLVVWVVRIQYLQFLDGLFPDRQTGGLGWIMVIGFLLLGIVTFIHAMVIRRKVKIDISK